MIQKVLIIHKDKLSSKRRREIMTAHRFLTENTPVEWKFTFKRNKPLYKQLVLESGDNLDEFALKKTVNEPEYDYIYVDMPQYLWKKLGLRKTLNGQARWIDGQGITYGRWTQRANDFVKHLPMHLHYLSEVGLGIVHEISHCLTYKFGLNYTTHYHFYGYKEKVTKQRDDRTPRPRKWQRKADPDKFFQELPWIEAPKTRTETLQKEVSRL